MIFRYVPWSVEATALTPSKVVHRPMVPLYVWGKKDALLIWALLDTGADHTLLPMSVANYVGVGVDETTSQVQAYGGGQLTVAGGDVDFKLSDGRDSLQWSATIGFVSFDQPEDEVAVLGHGEGLEFFRVTFDGQRRQVELEPTADFRGTVAPPGQSDR